MKIFRVMGIAVLLCGTAQAVQTQPGIGSFLPKKDNPSQTCELVSYVGQEPAGLCTGTLIHPRVVLTAAHCLMKPATAIGVRCGNENVKRSAVAIASHPGFRIYQESREATGTMADVSVYFTNENDLGAVLVGKPLPASIRPMAIPRDDAHLLELLAAGNCKAAGYGLGNDGLTGTLRSAAIRHFTGAVLPEDFKKIRNIGFGAEGNHVAPGDSGGTLACKDPSSGEWILVGAHRASVGTLQSIQDWLTMIRGPYWISDATALHSGMTRAIRWALDAVEKYSL